MAKGSLNCLRGTTHRTQAAKDRCAYCRKESGKKPLKTNGASDEYLKSITHVKPEIDLEDPSQFRKINYYFNNDLDDSFMTAGKAKILKNLVNIDYEEGSFHNSDYTGYYEAWVDEEPVSIEWRDPDIELTDKEVEVLLENTNDHFLEYMKSHDINNKDYWDLNIRDVSDYYSRTPDVASIELNEKGQELVNDYNKTAEDYLKSIKLNNPTKYLQRRYDNDNLTKDKLLQSILFNNDKKSKFNNKKVSRIEANKLTINDLNNATILNKVEFNKIKKDYDAKKSGARKTGLSRRLYNNNDYYGVIIAEPKKKVHNPSNNNDYNFTIANGYENLAKHLDKQTLHGQKEWLIFYTD